MTEYQFSKLAELGDYVDINADDMRARSAAFFNEIKRRHTVRDYAPDPVPLEVIRQCLATAGRAPSGANQQPWHFVAISDPAMKSEIRAAAEAEEEKFYSGGAGDAWLKALEPIGTGVGLLGTLARCTLTWPAGVDGPTSMVAKLPTTDPANQVREAHPLSLQSSILFVVGGRHRPPIRIALTKALSTIKPRILDRTPVRTCLLP